MDDEEEFWNKSNIQSFSFDEDEKVSIILRVMSNTNHSKIFQLTGICN